MKTDTTWPLPGTPLWGKSQGHQDFLAKTWASAWTQLERQEPKRLAFPDPETSDSMGPRELAPLWRLPTANILPHRPVTDVLCCKQPVPPKAEGKAGGASSLGGEAGTGPPALTPGIGCLWQALATVAGGELAKHQNFLPGGLQGDGWGYCFSSHYRQVAGMSSPTPTTAEGPGLEGGGCV